MANIKVKLPDADITVEGEADSLIPALRRLMGIRMEGHKRAGYRRGHKIIDIPSRKECVKAWRSGAYDEGESVPEKIKEA